MIEGLRGEMKKRGFTYDPKKKLWDHQVGFIFEDEVLDDFPALVDFIKELQYQTRVLGFGGFKW